MSIQVALFAEPLNPFLSRTVQMQAHHTPGCYLMTAPIIAPPCILDCTSQSSTRGIIAVAREKLRKYTPPHTHSLWRCFGSCPPPTPPQPPICALRIPPTTQEIRKAARMQKAGKRSRLQSYGKAVTLLDPWPWEAKAQLTFQLTMVCWDAFQDWQDSWAAGVGFCPCSGHGFSGGGLSSSMRKAEE